MAKNLNGAAGSVASVVPGASVAGDAPAVPPVPTDAERLAAMEAAAAAAAEKAAKGKADDKAASALLRGVWNTYADATNKDALSGLKGTERGSAIRGAGFTAFVGGVKAGLWDDDRNINPSAAGGSVWVKGAGLGGRGETINPARALLAFMSDGKTSSFVGKRAS